MIETHKDEDPVRIGFPVFSHLLVLFRRISRYMENIGPEPSTNLDVSCGA